MIKRTMTRADVHDFLRSLNGKIFTVEFTKRTTGELRLMRCTTNYKKHLAGGELAYNPTEKHLIPVVDLDLLRQGDKRPFRSIPTDAVIRIRALGNEYEVK